MYSCKRNFIQFQLIIKMNFMCVVILRILHFFLFFFILTLFSFHLTAWQPCWCHRKWSFACENFTRWEGFTNDFKTVVMSCLDYFGRLVCFLDLSAWESYPMNHPIKLVVNPANHLLFVASIAKNLQQHEIKALPYWWKISQWKLTKFWLSD